MASSSADLERVRGLVLRYGWNATAYQILNPGIEHWLGPRDRGVVGFVRQPRRWIAAGAPVCDEADLGGVAGAFERSAAAAGGARVCYFGAAERLRRAVGSSPAHATVAIGAQPVWDPRDWPDVVRRRASLRHQLNRARHKGVTVVPASAAQSRRASTDAQLRRCLGDWLASRPLPPMHFLVEPAALDGVLADRRLYVAVRERRPVAFLVASPVPRRNGYLIEQVVRGRAAPNGTAELLIDACMRDVAGRGGAYVTQGLVALSRRAQDEIDANPLWLRAVMAWARAHGNRFYHFRGLETFRAKMEPQRWETIYAIANEPWFSPATLYAVARAFCRGSPAAAVARAVATALKHEAAWLGGRRRRW